MSNLIKENKTKSKKEIVYNLIKDEIISCKLQPGTLLVERQLCESLDTSRTPVREALQRLAHDGFVDYITGKGATVSYVTYENVIEIYNLREVLEGLACRLCALLIDDDQLKILEGLFMQRLQSIQEKNYQEIILNDFEFHCCIINNARSERLKCLINNIQDQIKRITYYGKGNEEEIAKATILHQKIFEAIQSKDAKSAEILMKEHVADSKQGHLTRMYNFK